MIVDSPVLVEVLNAMKKTMKEVYFIYKDGNLRLMNHTDANTMFLIVDVSAVGEDSFEELVFIDDIIRVIGKSGKAEIVRCQGYFDGIREGKKFRLPELTIPDTGIPKTTELPVSQNTIRVK